jgi:hypothetical protein
MSAPETAASGGMTASSHSGHTVPAAAASGHMVAAAASSGHAMPAMPAAAAAFAAGNLDGLRGSRCI